MGYRSDIGLCLSDKAVQELQKRLAAVEPDSEEGTEILSLFNSADVHLINDDAQEKLWVWHWMKWYGEYPEVRFLESLLADLDEDDFLFVRVGEDYADIEHQGFMWDNSFSLRVTRTIAYCEPGPKAVQAASPNPHPPASDRSPQFAEFRMCDASTDHIKPQDNNILAECRRSECDVVIAYPCERGYFLYLDPDFVNSDYAERMARAGFSAEFAALLRMAKQAGFDWLKLDADAPAYPELPIFEW